MSLIVSWPFFMLPSLSSILSTRLSFNFPSNSLTRYEFLPKFSLKTLYHCIFICQFTLHLFQDCELLEDKDPVLFISVSRTRIVSGLQGLRNSVLNSVWEKFSLLEKLEACLILLKYLLLRMFVIHKWTYLCGRNWLKDIENRLVVAKGEGRGGGMDWEFD